MTLVEVVREAQRTGMWFKRRPHGVKFYLCGREVCQAGDLDVDDILADDWELCEP